MNSFFKLVLGFAGPFLWDLGKKTNRVCTSKNLKLQIS